MTSRESPKSVYLYSDTDSANDMVSPAVHIIAIPGKSINGPANLSADVVTAFLDYEKRGLHTVLIAAESEDLYTPVAKVCRRVVAVPSKIRQEARELWGTENVLEADSVSPVDIFESCKSLPVPASLTWQRRVRNIVRDLPGVGKVLTKLRS